MWNNGHGEMKRFGSGRPPTLEQDKISVRSVEYKVCLIVTRHSNSAYCRLYWPE